MKSLKVIDDDGVIHDVESASSWGGHLHCGRKYQYKGVKTPGLAVSSRAYEPMDPEYRPIAVTCMRCIAEGL